MYNSSIPSCQRCMCEDRAVCVANDGNHEVPVPFFNTLLGKALRKLAVAADVGQAALSAFKQVGQQFVVEA